jgi:hypothetical protein
MNIKEYIMRILRLWNTDKRTRDTVSQSANKNDMLVKVMHMVEQTEDIELSCDELLELIDRYTELVVRGEDAASMYPLVKKHLDGCGDCREEFEALMRILESSAAENTFTAPKDL